MGTRTSAFVPILDVSTDSRLCGSKKEDFDAVGLQSRLTDLRVEMMEQEIRMPPNPDLSAVEFLRGVLQGLKNNGDPMPDSGFRLLLRSSTKDWRKLLFDAVGAPPTADDELVAAALGQAMSRSDNQFALLVGEAEEFDLSFPSDPLDYSDGTCWVECRFREETTDRLLAITGWQLERRTQDGAWLVDQIDWQDFRDEFRPGVGREEWMRICG